MEGLRAAAETRVGCGGKEGCESLRACGAGTESAVCLCGHWSPGLAACRTVVGEGGRSRTEWSEVEGKGDSNQKLAQKFLALISWLHKVLEFVGNETRVLLPLKAPGMGLPIYVMKKSCEPLTGRPGSET